DHPHRRSYPTRRSSDLLLMCLAVSLFPFLNASSKLLTADYSIAQIVWARFAGHLLFMLLAFLPLRGWRLLIAHRPALQVGRSVLDRKRTRLNSSHVASS